MGKSFALNWFSGFSVLVGMFSGVVTLAAFLKFEEYIVPVSISILAIFFSIFFIQKIIAYRTIRGSIKKLINELSEKRKSPEIIICFDRTSAIFASILAQNMGVESILVLNRRREGSSNNKHGTTKVTVGNYIHIDGEELNRHNILIFSYHVRTGTTLKSGLDYLSENGVDTSKATLASIYMVSGNIEVFPNMIYAYQEDDNRKTHDSLPWILKDYDYR